MSRNGSGTYSLPAGNPVVTGTVISSTVQNTTMNDIATALTQSIASTGVTTPTANLPMGSYRHTGVGNASARACYSSVTDIQNGSLVTLGAVAGTDTITATAPFTVTAYASGQGFRFIAAATNTGAVTINIDGLGAKSITKQGTTALVAGDITSGQVVNIVYDGTRFQMIGARIAAAVQIALQSFTSSGTYTPTSGMQYCVVYMVGGGGGGAEYSSGNYPGGGGGAGEGAIGVFTAADIGASKAVTVGAGGAVNSNGTASSLGSLLTAEGGAAPPAANYVGGVGGTGGTGTGIHIRGGYGSSGALLIPSPGTHQVGGTGGASMFGGGVRGGSNSSTDPGTPAAYGSGGGGNGFVASAWGTASAGKSGAVFIYEYF